VRWSDDRLRWTDNDVNRTGKTASGRDHDKISRSHPPQGDSQSPSDNDDFSSGSSTRRPKMRVSGTGTDSSQTRPDSSRSSQRLGQPNNRPHRPHPTVRSDQDSQNPGQITTRSGRRVRPPNRIDL
jgi:hypothetical protein